MQDAAATGRVRMRSASALFPESLQTSPSAEGTDADGAPLPPTRKRGVSLPPRPELELVPEGNPFDIFDIEQPSPRRALSPQPEAAAAHGGEGEGEGAGAGEGGPFPRRQ